MRKREKTRSTRHEKSLKRKIGFKLPLIAVLLALIICLGLFVANQRHPVQKEKADRVETSSSKKKKVKKSSEKKTPRASNVTGYANANVQGAGRPASRSNGNLPNAGKVLKYDSIESAEAAIQQHEATCPYETDYCYNGVVYAGTYQCKCGLRIVWWDQAAKESIDRDTESLREKDADSSESNYDTSDSATDTPAADEPSSSGTESSSVDEYKYNE